MQHSSATLTWIPFYTELAQILLQYRDDRRTLLKLLERCYQAADMRFPKMSMEGPAHDIDPFSVFGLFNRGLSDAKRLLLLRHIKDFFSVSMPLPEDFEGIPVVNNLSATFLDFDLDRRGEKDVDNLWKLFETALRYAQKPSVAAQEKFEAIYDVVITQRGIRWNLSMGLFWIAPYTYLSLDSRNRWFLTESAYMDAPFDPEIIRRVPSGRDYLYICLQCKGALKLRKLPFTNFPELSKEAWRVSQAVNNSREVHQLRFWDTDLPEEEDADLPRYWLYAPGDGACMWDAFYREGVMGIGWSEIGDLRDYGSKADMKRAMQERIDPTRSYTNAAHATWQFCHEMKPGDIVFVKKGMTQLVGRGVVASDYQYDEERTDGYNNIRQVRWTHQGIWAHPGQAVMKTLTDITPYTEYVAQLNALFEDASQEDAEERPGSYPLYTEEKFLQDVYMDQDALEDLTGLLKAKKNIILQGPPGVGKTYAAKRLAYAMMGAKDTSRVMMIQFHQSYSYEDFVMGYKPSGAGFTPTTGAFYNFCKKAEVDSDNAYFCIIDEINRGNLNRIFGELLMLIEHDKRGQKLQLLYSNELFSVPENLYIIGMMNTADRSLALIDYALRRRFGFFDMRPGFDSDGFRRYVASQDSPELERLVACVKELNEAIAADETLGEGFCIGHSFFCQTQDVSARALSAIIRYELIPLLREYWFDEPQKVREWSERLGSALT